MFMHSWAITAGVAALSVPFIVHWLTKPYPTRMPLSTIRFVKEVIQQRKARNRLRDLIILFLRAAAIALFALVLARPLSGNRSALNADSGAKTVRIVILDVSQSMAAQANGIQAIERARPIAARLVEYQSGLQANLILGAAAPRAVFERPSSNVAAMVTEISNATVLPQRLQVQACLNSAAEMLSQVADDKVRRELVIISDFQRTNWVTADFSVLPTQTEIQLESVAPAETPVNLAIMRVTPQGRVEQARPFRMEVEIGNYSPSAREVAVEMTLGDAQYRLQGTCTAGVNSILTTEVTATSEGWTIGEARLVGIDDGLKADDRRAVVIQVHRQPTYLLLSRQTAESRSTSSYYVERAISPNSSPRRKEAERIVRADPSRVERETITAADLIVLDHPGKLSDETCELLSGLMLRGRGVFYIVAEPIDATNLKRLATTAGTSLQMPVEFSPPSTGQIRKNLFLTDVKHRQVPFAIFGDETTAVISPLRFGGGLSSRRLEGGLIDDVCATYNDQSACLLVTACGMGSLAVLNAELSASNLPASPAFVPMIGELVNHLLGQNRTQEAVFSGEPLAVFLPPEANPVAGLEIHPPSGTSVDEGSLGELHDEAAGIVWQASAAGPPGAYTVRRGRESLFAVASVIPSEEGDLATLSSDLMTTRLSGGRDVKYRSALDSEESRDDLWSKLAVICLVCVCAEFLSLKLFRC